MPAFGFFGEISFPFIAVDFRNFRVRAWFRIRRNRRSVQPWRLAYLAWASWRNGPRHNWNRFVAAVDLQIRQERRTCDERSKTTANFDKSRRKRTFSRYHRELSPCSFSVPSLYVTQTCVFFSLRDFYATRYVKVSIQLSLHYVHLA